MQVRLKYWLYEVLILLLGASRLTFLGLRFLICKVEKSLIGVSDNFSKVIIIVPG